MAKSATLSEIVIKISKKNLRDNNSFPLDSTPIDMGGKEGGSDIPWSERGKEGVDPKKKVSYPFPVNKTNPK